MSELLRRAFVIARQRSDVGRRMPGMEVHMLPHLAHFVHVSAHGATAASKGSKCACWQAAES